MTTNGTILAVDDTHSTLKLLSDILGVHGYRVLPADSGSLALKAAISNSPDLILLDLRLPDMDGFEVFRRLGEIPGMARPPVIFLSAASETALRVEGLRLGAVDFINKPFQAEELIARVGIHMELRSAHKKLEQQSEDLLALNRELELHVRDRTSRLEAINRELESFNHSISHDLRTKLRAMNGFSRILLEEHAAGLNPEGARMLEIIRRGAVGMESLLDAMQTYTDLGKRELKVEEIDMTALARAVFEKIAADSGILSKPATLVLDELASCQADKAMMQTLWLNLIGNAVKFSAGSPRPRVEIGSTVSPGHTEYFIKDNGTGFKPEYAGKLFTLFQRLHAQNEFPGIGAGLAIVKRIVERHGGTVGATASPDSGACFHFSLPAEKP